MACVAELGRDSVSVAPVQGGLGCASEEVSGVSGQSEAGYSAHYFGFALDEHVLGANLGNSAITRTREQVTVR